MNSGFETLESHWCIGRRSFTFSGLNPCTWGTSYVTFFKTSIEIEVFSVCCMLWLAWECLAYSICQIHSIKSLSQLYSYVADRLQGDGICKVRCEIDALIYSLLKGSHNWDRRADFQITFLPAFLLSHSIVYGEVG